MAGFRAGSICRGWFDMAGKYHPQPERTNNRKQLEQEREPVCTGLHCPARRVLC
jgi:hypothetical protein